MGIKMKSIILIALIFSLATAQEKGT